MCILWTFCANADTNKNEQILFFLRCLLLAIILHVLSFLNSYRKYLVTSISRSLIKDVCVCAMFVCQSPCRPKMEKSTKCPEYFNLKIGFKHFSQHILVERIGSLWKCRRFLSIRFFFFVFILKIFWNFKWNFGGRFSFLFPLLSFKSNKMCSVFLRNYKYEKRRDRKWIWMVFTETMFRAMALKLLC